MTTAPRVVEHQVPDDGLVVDDLHRFLAHELPVREPLLAPWLLTQGLSMIHSWRGVGKTHVALGVAYAVASGSRFLTWRAPTARKVLLVDGEMPAPALQDRLAALVRDNDVEAGPGMLRILTPDRQPLGIMPDLSTVEGQLALDKVVERDTDLIVLDNLSALCRTGKENEAESWLSVATWALKQRAAGRSVLFIHHSGKGGLQRGTSRREDLLDIVIGLRRPADYLPQDGAVFEIHYEKARHLSGNDVAAIEAKLEENEAASPAWTWRPVEQSTQDRVVALANEGLSQKEIAEELGVNKSNVSRAMRAAKQNGQIKA